MRPKGAITGLPTVTVMFRLSPGCTFSETSAITVCKCWRVTENEVDEPEWHGRFANRAPYT